MIIQFSTDTPYRTDLLCRSTIDATVHANLLHDDSAIIDLIATRRPVAQSPTGEPGAHITVIPGEILTRPVWDAAKEIIQGTERFIKGTPRTVPDGKKKTPGDVSGQWLAAIKYAFKGHDLPKGPSTALASFNRQGHLTVEGIAYPIAGGVDIDKLVKSIGVALGIDVCDFIASKRLAEPPGYGAITIAEGQQLTSKRLNALLQLWTGVQSKQAAPA